MLVAVLLALPSGAWASEASRPFAAPAAAAPAGGTASGLFEITFALLVVLAAIFGFAWLARRARLLSGHSHGRIEVVADLSLGVKERVVLVRVRDAELLLGVAPGRVSTLHTFSGVAATASDGEPSTPADSPRPPTFAELLRKSLGR